MPYIKTKNFVKQQPLNLLYNAASLEHLLIATLIASIIMLSMFQTYDIIKKQLLIIEQQIIILYNQLVADFFLRTNLRNAGYKGFVSTIPLPQHSSINNSYQNQIIPQTPIAICKATVNSCKDFVTNKILNKIVENKIKPNTDILLAYDIPYKITFLTKNMQEYNSQLHVNSIDDTWKIGEQMIIADHRNIQRFIISNINITEKTISHNQPYNTTNNFIKTYSKGAEIFRVKHVAFYIAKNSGYQSNVYSLYIDDFSSNHMAEAILDHVEDFWIQSLDPNSKAQHIYTANQGWNFNKYLLINFLMILKNRLI